MSSLRRSYRPMVLVFEWPAMCCATSMRPPFVRYCVIPVARHGPLPRQLAPEAQAHKDAP
jgi:hypothetical protein